jgi:uncharacterized protein
MPRHLAIEWPDPAPFRERDGAPIRLLAVSDVLEPALLDLRNKAVIGPIDLIVGCGDLNCDDLAFVADAFDAPLVFVTGNHDAGQGWQNGKEFCPEPIESTAVLHRAGVAIAGLAWPGKRGKGGFRSERIAWRQALGLVTRRRMGGSGPLIVISHVPPLGAGDVATDPYHRGFKGYRWLLAWLEPALWLHGHTPLAAVRDWKLQVGTTTIANVSGAVVVELMPPASDAAVRRRRLGRAPRSNEPQLPKTPVGTP